VWLLPTDDFYGTWAASGEVDIVEYRSQDENVLEQTIHYGGRWPNNSHIGTGKKSFQFNFTDDFHLFVWEWTPEDLTWFVDDQKTFHVSLNRSFWNGKGVNPYYKFGSPFDKKFYLLVNVAVAGNFFPASEYGNFNASSDPETWISPHFQIDYIRVLQYPNDIPGDFAPEPSPETSPEQSPERSPEPLPPGSNFNFIDWITNGGWMPPTILGLGGLALIQTLIIIGCACKRRSPYTQLHHDLDNYSG
jgi:beta-glucanase (GH16 family)